MTWYFIRITTDNSSKKHLSTIFPPPYLISKEYSKRMKLHYHIVHQTDLVKDDIKTLVYTTFPDAPKGIHTLKIDVIGSTPEDLDTSCTYTVKDKDFIYSPYFEPKIQEYIDNSYSKPTNYTAQVKLLIAQHTDCEYHRINWRTLKAEIMILQSSFPLMPVYESKIDAIILGIKIGLNNNIAYEYNAL